MRSLFSPSHVLVALVAAASIATAKPIVKIRENPTFNLEFALQLNHSGMRVPDFDRTRVAAKLTGAHLNGRRHQRHKRAAAAAIDASNTAVTYVASVGIGSPPTQYSLVVDTGSSNTWVGAGKTFVVTNSSVDLHQNVSVSYGTGSFSGKEYNDTVTLSSELVIKDQSIGVANKSQGFTGYDGILGLGPAALTKDTVSGVDEVRTVSDNLLAEGEIGTEVLGVSFAPTTTAPNANGVLTFGGVDASRYMGAITYTPITSVSPASNYWGIDQSLSYGSQKATLLNTTSGIVDTGSTLLLIAQDAFETYTNLTNATVDQNTGLLKISDADYAKLESLYFEIGGTTFELTANAQRLPQAFNALVGGEPNSTYLTIGSLGSYTGLGIDFINGLTFLERFYSVYDETNKRVGFATTNYTYATV